MQDVVFHSVRSICLLFTCFLLQLFCFFVLLMLKLFTRAREDLRIPPRSPQSCYDWRCKNDVLVSERAPSISWEGVSNPSSPRMLFWQNGEKTEYFARCILNHSFLAPFCAIHVLKSRWYALRRILFVDASATSTAGMTGMVCATGCSRWPSNTMGVQDQERMSCLPVHERLHTKQHKGQSNSYPIQLKYSQENEEWGVKKSTRNWTSWLGSVCTQCLEHLETNPARPLEKETQQEYV